jgi:hypothetical protein
MRSGQPRTSLAVTGGGIAERTGHHHRHAADSTAPGAGRREGGKAGIAVPSAAGQEADYVDLLARPPVADLSTSVSASNTSGKRTQR